MNGFLAPLHFLMYEKILFLNEYTENYIKIAEENDVELKELESFTAIEDKPLDSIIDMDNIHQWIETRVDSAEGKFAYVVSEILKKDENLLIELLKYSYRRGRDEYFSKNADDAFKLIVSKFLDGMPCDGCISLVESEKDHVKFIIEKDAHKKFWKYGISSEYYWEIRNKYIKGLLSSSRYFLYRQDNVYEIKEIHGCSVRIV